MLNKLKDVESSKLTKEEVYDFLHVYLEEQISMSLREVTNEKAFDKPAWGEYTAYQLGMQKAFSKIKALIPDQGKK